MQLEFTFTIFFYLLEWWNYSISLRIVDCCQSIARERDIKVHTFLEVLNGLPGSNIFTYPSSLSNSLYSSFSFVVPFFFFFGIFDLLAG